MSDEELEISSSTYQFPLYLPIPRNEEHLQALLAEYADISPHVRIADIFRSLFNFNLRYRELYDAGDIERAEQTAKRVGEYFWTKVKRIRHTNFLEALDLVEEEYKNKIPNNIRENLQRLLRSYLLVDIEAGAKDYAQQCIKHQFPAKYIDEFSQFAFNIVLGTSPSQKESQDFSMTSSLLSFSDYLATSSDHRFPDIQQLILPYPLSRGEMMIQLLRNPHFISGRSFNTLRRNLEVGTRIRNLAQAYRSSQNKKEAERHRQRILDILWEEGLSKITVFLKILEHIDSPPALSPTEEKKLIEILEKGEEHLGKNYMVVAEKFLHKKDRMMTFKEYLETLELDELFDKYYSTLRRKLVPPPKSH
ncbi:MAG: hypothetical protein ACFFCQ_08475 [Promethearchaeota archaeon]